MLWIHGVVALLVSLRLLLQLEFEPKLKTKVIIVVLSFACTTRVSSACVWFCVLHTAVVSALLLTRVHSFPRVERAPLPCTFPDVSLRFQIHVHGFDHKAPLMLREVIKRLLDLGPHLKEGALHNFQVTRVCFARC